MTQSDLGLAARVGQVLQLKQLLPNVCAGLVVGLVTLTFNLSFAALIFSGELSQYLSFGISSALVSTAVMTLFFVGFSSFAIAISSLDFQACGILAGVVATLSQQLTMAGLTDAVFPTVWAAVVLGSLLTGLCLLLVGRLHLSYIVRFIPYPVVGGFLAGTGWLLIRGSFKVTTGHVLSLEFLPQLWQGERLLHWLPSLLFALLLQWILPRYKQFWVFPGCLLAAVGLTYLGFWWQGISLSQAADQGWLFMPFAQGGPTELFQGAVLAQVNWTAVLEQSLNLVTMVGVIAISMLLNATALEIDTEQDVDLDQELQLAGWAHLAIALLGGIVGHLSVKLSLLNVKAGANSRLAGLVAGLLYIAVLFVGTSWLSYLPKPVLGSLLLYVGFGLWVEWIYQAWFKLPRLEYGLLLVIALIIATLGFLPGVGMGLVIACLLFAFDYSRVQVVRHALTGQEHQSNFQRSPLHQTYLQDRGEQLWFLSLQGYIFFGTSNQLLNQIRQRLGDTQRPPLKFLVLDFRLVNGLDASAILSFSRIKQLNQTHQVRLVFTHLQPTYQQQLERNDCLERYEAGYLVFPDLDRGVEWCENTLLQACTVGLEQELSFVTQLESVFLSREGVLRFQGYLELLQVVAGTVLFTEGATPDGLYFVESGQVSIFLEVQEGALKRLRTLGAGTVVGEMGLYRASPRSASAVVEQPSRLYRLSQASLQRMQQQDPELAVAFHQFIIRLLAERLAHANRELEILFD